MPFDQCRIIRTSLFRGKPMASEATMTIIKMLETLPEQAQDRVVEHLR